MEGKWGRDKVHSKKKIQVHNRDCGTSTAWGPDARNLLFLTSASRVIFRKELKETSSFSLSTWAGSQDSCVFGRKQKPRSEETADRKGGQRRAKGVERLIFCLSLSACHSPPPPRKARTRGRQARGYRVDVRGVRKDDSKSKVPWAWQISASQRR